MTAIEGQLIFRHRPEVPQPELPVEPPKLRCFEVTPAHQVNFRPLVAKLPESRRAFINMVALVSVLYHFLAHILIRTVLDPCVVLPVF